jgi:hypothetical protein
MERMGLYTVHCAGLLDVQNILSADTVVSPGKLKVIHSVITWSVRQSVLRHQMLQKLLLCSVLCLYDSCESLSNQPALWTPGICRARWNHETAVRMFVSHSNTSWGQEFIYIITSYTLILPSHRYLVVASAFFLSSFATEIFHIYTDFTV